MVQPGYNGQLDNSLVDWNRILEVTAWNQNAFNKARRTADKFLCPELLSLKLTEVRMEQYVNGNTTYQSKFIEVYNYGKTAIDLSVDTLKFSGFMTSDSFGTATANSNCQIIINPKQYLVIYDKSSDIPDCPNCNCTLSGSPEQQCDEALYIPCDGTLGTNNCGICTWNNHNNDQWNQQALDYAGMCY